MPVWNADTARVAKGVQILLPIAWQPGSRELAKRNIRLLNCWLGIATREHIGTTFCTDCEYLSSCTALYIWFAERRRMHPASLARKVIRVFEIDSEYMK